MSNELFKENSVTVINFWFSACAPCIGELGELNALNEELKLKGGAVIGINADTIGGDESMIMEAKNILEKKGAMYQNIYFPADSEAGKLTYSITAVPHHRGGGPQRQHGGRANSGRHQQREADEGAADHD